MAELACHPEPADTRLITRLRATCALAIKAHGDAPFEKRLAILMLIYRIQDHIARARKRDLLIDAPVVDGWVDSWRPE